jgi:hypothetical protein
MKQVRVLVTDPRPLHPSKVNKLWMWEAQSNYLQTFKCHYLCLLICTLLNDNNSDYTVLKSFYAKSSVLWTIQSLAREQRPPDSQIKAGHNKHNGFTIQPQTKGRRAMRTRARARAHTHILLFQLFCVLIVSILCMILKIKQSYWVHPAHMH